MDIALDLIHHETISQKVEKRLREIISFAWLSLTSPVREKPQDIFVLDELPHAVPIVKQ